MKRLSEFRTTKNNGGYSLVEMIIVVSMLAIGIGIVSLGLMTMFSRDAESAAKTIDDQMSEVRMAAMSKPGVYVMTIKTVSSGKGNTIEIKRTSDPSIPAELSPATDEVTEIPIDKSTYIMFAKQGSMPADHTSASYGSIEIMFNKANGSVESVKAYGTDLTDLDRIYEIKCQSVRNESKEKTIEIMPVTGRHYIKQE